MKKATMHTAAFNRLIEATKAFCSKNNTRPIHNYICLEFHSKSDEVVAVAVDGYRLSVEHAVATSEEDFRVYVKGNVKLPPKTTVDIELVDNEAMKQCSAVKVSFSDINSLSANFWIGQRLFPKVNRISELVSMVNIC